MPYCEYRGANLVERWGEMDHAWCQAVYRMYMSSSHGFCCVRHSFLCLYVPICRRLSVRLGQAWCCWPLCCGLVLLTLSATSVPSWFRFRYYAKYPISCSVHFTFFDAQASPGYQIICLISCFMQAGWPHLMYAHVLHWPLSTIAGRLVPIRMQCVIHEWISPPLSLMLELPGAIWFPVSHMISIVKYLAPWCSAVTSKHVCQYVYI